MNEKMVDLQQRLGSVVSQETIEKLAAMIPDNVPPASVVPIIAGVVKQLPAGLSGDEVVAEVGKQMKNKAQDNRAQAKDKAGSVRGLTRQYYDSLLIEMRLMGAKEPSTQMDFFGHTVSSPIMTGAMSHMSLYREGVDGPMEFLARGAAQADCIHWVGMTENDHFAQIMKTGAKVVRVVKPYASEEKIADQLKQAEALGCVAVAMDIDHVLTSHGENDMAMGEELAQKTLEQMHAYTTITNLPFIIKGVLSVHDAVCCRQIGADGIMVSHHGGRLTYLTPPPALLPQIKKAVGDEIKVFADCGICSGMDAYKAMALGAQAVGVGTHLAGLARTKDADAVAARLREMTAELKGVMYFTGIPDCQSFDETVIHKKDF